MKTGLVQTLRPWSILQRREPDTSNPIKTAAAVERTGYYPTVSCVRYDTARDTYNVSMEEFVLRERSDPGPPALLAPPTLTSSNR